MCLQLYSIITSLLLCSSLSIAQAEQLKDDETLSQDFIEFLLEMEQTTRHDDDLQVLENILFEDISLQPDKESSSRLSGALADE